MAEFYIIYTHATLRLEEKEIEAFEEILETAAETGDLTPQAAELVTRIIEDMISELG